MGKFVRGEKFNESRNKRCGRPFVVFGTTKNDNPKLGFVTDPTIKSNTLYIVARYLDAYDGTTKSYGKLDWILDNVVLLDKPICLNGCGIGQGFVAPKKLLTPYLRSLNLSLKNNAFRLIAGPDRTVFHS